MRLRIFSAKDLLKHRQKIIKLADQSEHGWRTVAEYETNPIASDSDDEKRIYRAEVRASRKSRFDRGGRRGRLRGHPYRRAPTFRRAAESSQGDSTQLQSQQSRRPGLCFGCSMPGHWKFECPSSKATNANNKISSIYTSVLCKEQNNMDSDSLNQNINGAKSSKDDGKNDNLLSPAGRLGMAYKKWKEITDDLYILSVIKDGYTLPLKATPPSIVLPNNRSARENMSFVQEEVKQLVRKGVVTQVEVAQKVVNPLTVAYSKKGKPRLVLDCRHINQFLHTFKYKYEDIKVAEDMFEEGSFLFTFDLKSAYHSIDINQGSRSWLGFSLQADGKVKYYVFNSLPFGLATAGHIFSKVLRVVVKFWRANGHKIIMFLDDGIGGSTRFSQAILSGNFARETLLSLGFLLAEEKCQWMPNQRVTWLGHNINMSVGKLFITEERIDRLEMAIQSLLYQFERDLYSLIPVRALASVVGQIISLQNVIGKKVRLMTRELYSCILSRASWNAPVLVTDEAKSELLFWKENARSLNASGKNLSTKTFIEACLFADASSKGYGGYVEMQIENPENGDNLYRKENSKLEVYCGPPDVGNNVSPDVDRVNPLDLGEVNFKQLEKSGPLEAGRNMLYMEQGKLQEIKSEAQRNGKNTNVQKVQYEKLQKVHEDKRPCGIIFGDWDAPERLRSSTWRESETVRRLIKSNVMLLQHKKIKVFSDNKNVQSILQIGSRKKDLQKIATDINQVCEQHNIELYTEWIPRDQNQEADDLSRCGDSDDWSVSNEVFAELNLKWGPHTVDRFASTHNAKLKRFNSRFWVPGTEAVNSLDQNWSGETNWVVPPPRLILKCIRKIECEKANGTIIVPFWQSAPYWTELHDINGSYKKFVADSILLPSENVIQKGYGNNGIFGKEHLSFRMLALKVRF